MFTAAANTINLSSALRAGDSIGAEAKVQTGPVVIDGKDFFDFKELAHNISLLDNLKEKLESCPAGYGIYIYRCDEQGKKPIEIAQITKPTEQRILAWIETWETPPQIFFNGKMKDNGFKFSPGETARFEIVKFGDKPTISSTNSKLVDPRSIGNSLAEVETQQLPPALPKSTDSKNAFQVIASHFVESNDERIRELNKALVQNDSVSGTVWFSYPNSHGWSNWIKLFDGTITQKQAPELIYAEHANNHIELNGFGEKIKINPQSILLFDLKKDSEQVKRS